MKKPWILIGILFMASSVWAQSENGANKESPKAKQRTEVTSSVSTPGVSSDSGTSSRNILVRNIPYRPSVTPAQTSAGSNKPVSQSKQKEDPSKQTMKPALFNSRNLVCRLRGQEKESLSPEECKRQGGVMVQASKASVGSNKPVPQSPQKENPVKQTEKASPLITRDTTCRLGGYEEDDMSPEECRRYGGLMVTTAQTSVRSDKLVSQSQQKEDPSKKTENVSLFNSRNLVCRLRGYEMENMSPEECRKQGGVMVTTVAVPTRHVPPLNGLYTGKREKFEKKEDLKQKQTDPLKKT